MECSVLNSVYGLSIARFVKLYKCTHFLWIVPCVAESLALSSVEEHAYCNQSGGVRISFVKIPLSASATDASLPAPQEVSLWGILWMSDVNNAVLISSAEFGKNQTWEEGVWLWFFVRSVALHCLAILNVAACISKKSFCDAVGGDCGHLSDQRGHYFAVRQGNYYLNLSPSLRDVTAIVLHPN